MLIQCKECQMKISDKAAFCPHCGYPMSSSVPTAKHYKRRKRLPNGFGQITKIKQNLRKPYRVMVTIGKTEYGKPICKLLKPVSYFETYNEAYAALMEYNKNPYDVTNSITVEELYNEWSEKKYAKLDKLTVKNKNSAWKKCEPLYKIEVRELRPYHIKKCFDSQDIPGNTKNVMKGILNQLLDYALEYDLVDRNYARNINVDSIVDKDERSVKEGHMTYTDEEIKELFSLAEHDIIAQMIAIQCYSGWRPGELCDLLIKDVDIDNWVFMGGSKTKAGRNRPVPIHQKIRGLVKRAYLRSVKLGSDTLFCLDNEKYNGVCKFSYSYFRSRYKMLINEQPKLNSKHKPHDGRKHFVTLAKKYNLDEYAIKYIVGHSIQDLTESTYTERSIEWLQNEMGKIEK